MFTLLRPPAALIKRRLADQAVQPLSYASTGMTRGDNTHGLPVNHHRTCLGRGRETYIAAIAAARRWAMYDLSWTSVFPSATPVNEGAVFATVVNHWGFWSVNPCRVVYVDETADDATGSRFRFAIGTLPDHAERGEERFTIEWDAAADAVWFEILAYAGPRHPIVWLGYPIMRSIQRRFGVQASVAMKRAVEQAGD